MPFSIESTSGKRITYVFWIGFLGLGIVGLWAALTWPKRVIWIPIMMVLGRAALPLLSFLATEPRYMLEALPACFIPGALGLGYLKTRSNSGGPWNRIAEGAT